MATKITKEEALILSTIKEMLSNKINKDTPARSYTTMKYVADYLEIPLRQVQPIFKSLKNKKILTVGGTYWGVRWYSIRGE